MAVDLRRVPHEAVNDLVELPTGVKSTLAYYIGSVVSSACMECVHVEDPQNPVCAGSAYYLEDPKIRESGYSSVNIPEECPALVELLLTRCALGELASRCTEGEGDYALKDIREAAIGFTNETLRNKFIKIQSTINDATAHFHDELSRAAVFLGLDSAK
jgi:hypothetical protein